MNILLISSNIACTPYAIYPLGLSMVAAALSKAGHEVHQFDFLQHNRSLEDLSNEINNISPDVIGLSIRNIDNVNLLHEQQYISVVKNIVKKIKEETDSPVILGGSGFSLMPEVILREVGADYGIVGEGEKAIVALVADIEAGISSKKDCIRGSSLLAGPEIPPANYDPSLVKFYLQRGNIVSIQTKRGCLHNCLYCTYPLLEGRNLRCREPKAVVDDIQLLIEEYGAGYIFFIDSVFNDDQKNYLKVIREIKNRGISFPWTAFFRPTGLDDEIIALMKETELKAGEIGSEAATDTTLRGLNKSFLFKDVVACNDMFAEHGIATAHYFMFGGPGETRDTVLSGIENIINLKKTVSFIFMGIRILPNTPLAKLSEREGIITEGQELLESVYYIAPTVDREWMEKCLTDAFSGIRHCVFPPDALDSSLEFLHKLGYSGSLWDMLIPGSKTQQKRSRHGNQ